MQGVGGAGRAASARVFRGPKGAAGLGHPSRCVSAADFFRSVLQPHKTEEIKDFLLMAWHRMPSLSRSRKIRIM